MKPAVLHFLTFFCLFVFHSEARAQSSRMYADMEKALQLYHAEQYEAALKIVRSVDTVALFTKQPWKIRYWRIAGGCLRKLNKNEEARIIYEQVAATDWTKPEMQDTVAIELLLEASFFFFDVSSRHNSRTCTDAGEKMSRKIHGPSSVDWTRFQMQRARQKFRFEGDYEGAALLGKNAISIWVKKHGQWNKTTRWLYKGLINIEVNSSNPSHAIELINKHMEISNRLSPGDLVSLYDSWTHLGTVYYELDQYDQAILAVKNSLQVAIQLKDESKIANRYLEIGRNLYQQKKYREAERYFRQAYALFSSFQSDML